MICVDLSQRSANQNFLHIARAFVDLAHAHIAINALDGEVAYVAVAAVDLDSIGANFFGHLAGKELGHGGFFEAGFACVFEAGGVMRQSASSFNLRGHIGEFELHGLVLKNRLAKALALFAVAERSFKRRARHAQRLRGDADAPAF